MHFTLLSVGFFFVLTTSVQSAPTASLDTATLLLNAQEAQQLNSQFRSANSTATGSCTNGDTTCINDAIATCVNGQFDTSNGSCSATQHCFALPSVTSKGTTITCTSEKSAQSLINAAGATGDITGSGSGGSNGTINPSMPSTSSGVIPNATASETPGSMDAASTVASTLIASIPIPSTPTASTPIASAPITATSQSVVTVTITLVPSSTITLPPATQTLSPEQASNFLSSLLAQGGPPTTDIPDCSDEPSETLSSSVYVTATDIPPSSPSVTPTTAIANNSASSGSGYNDY